MIPLVSLCMVLRNEASGLSKCLDSVREWVDEIVVVDTGSSDRTVEIAERYGAKVYHHPWEHDFSKHRNQSLSHASGQWALILDGDEELRHGDGPKLREAVLVPGADSVMIKVANIFNHGMSQSVVHQVRLFRRDPSIYYAGIVHNQLKGYRSTRFTPAMIYHYGYDLDPDKMKEKFLRTSTLLKKRIDQEPENFRHYHDLAVSYSMNRMEEEAAAYGIKAIELSEKTEKKGGILILWTYFIVSSSFLIRRDYPPAVEWARKAIERFSEHLDSWFVLVMAYREMKKWERMREASDRYFAISRLLESDPATAGYMVFNTAGEVWRVHLAMGEYFLETSRPGDAFSSFEKGILSAFSPPTAAKLTADIHSNRCLWPEATGYYRKAVALKPDFLEALLGLGYAWTRMRKHSDAESCYRQAIQWKPDSLEALLGLGDLLFEGGRWEEAGLFYMQATQIEPRSIRVYLKMAKLSLKTADLEACVHCCESILRSLDLPADHTLEALADLSRLFLLIAHALEKAGREDLFREAAEIALTLHPEILREEHSS